METIALFARPDRSESDGKIRFRGVAYSGGVVPNYGFFGDLVVDLAGAQIAERVSVLRNHDGNQIAGRARLSISDHQVLIEEGEFTEATEAGRETAALFAEDHPWQLSIGLNGDLEPQRGAREIEVNGRKLQADAILRNPRILEVSFVPAGADPQTSVARMSARHASTQPEEGRRTMTTENVDLAAAQLRVTELEGQNQTLTDRVAELESQRAALQTQIDDAAKAVRLKAVKAMLGEDASDEEIAPYLDMSDTQFAAAQRLAGIRSDAPDHLFTEQANGGVDLSSDEGKVAEANKRLAEFNGDIVAALKAVGVK